MAAYSDGYIAGLADESLERLLLLDGPEHPLDRAERARLFYLLLERRARRMLGTPHGICRSWKPRTT